MDAAGRNRVRDCSALQPLGLVSAAEYAGLFGDRAGAVRAGEPGSSFPLSGNPQTLYRSRYSRGWRRPDLCGSILAGLDEPCRATSYRLDEIMPEYQFSERHSARIHAQPEQAMQALREATFGDMRSLITLLKIRGAVLRHPVRGFGDLQNKRILDAFLESGYLSGGSEHEIVIFGFGMRGRIAAPTCILCRSWQITGNRVRSRWVLASWWNRLEKGGLQKSTRRRVCWRPGDTSRGMARYWRLIVPGSGLLRLQWLEGIRKRAESMPNLRS